MNNPNLLKKVNLTRIIHSPEGTFGILEIGDKYFYSAELPWKDNKRRMSCVPEGKYECVITRSPKFGLVYWLTDVPGRDAVLIHSGNYAGDKELGYKTHIEGCILLGKKFGILDGQHAVLMSKPAIREFMTEMENKPFILEIKNA